jgi:preprotein translocase subunit SecG
METPEIILGIAILIFALFIIISVLMQHGKSKHLSGTIAGGAETFFGKERGKTIDKVLSTVTSVVAVIFVIAVIVLYIVNSAHIA